MVMWIGQGDDVSQMQQLFGYDVDPHNLTSQETNRLNMTRVEVEACLMLAAKIMDAGERVKPMGFVSNWPAEIIQSFNEAYGYSEATSREQFNAKQVEMANTVILSWIPMLRHVYGDHVKTQKVLKSLYWYPKLESFDRVGRRIQKEMGLYRPPHKNTVRGWYNDAIDWLHHNI